jgi:hypothetical protein
MRLKEKARNVLLRLLYQHRKPSIDENSDVAVELHTPADASLESSRAVGGSERMVAILNRPETCIFLDKLRALSDQYAPGYLVSGRSWLGGLVGIVLGWRIDKEDWRYGPR